MLRKSNHSPWSDSVDESDLNIETERLNINFHEEMVDLVNPTKTSWLQPDFTLSL